MSSVMVILCPNSVGHTAPKSVQISPYSVRMRENTDQKKMRIWTLFTQYHSYLERRCTSVALSGRKLLENGSEFSLEIWSLLKKVS